jgi:MoxR-like ATPase
MVAIHTRVTCDVPAVLVGECGVGKTQLLRALTEWLGVRLHVLDIHGGTSEADIRAIFAEAIAALQGGAKANPRAGREGNSNINEDDDNDDADVEDVTVGDDVREAWVFLDEVRSI